MAYFVHLFTATGAVIAMLAMLAAVEQEWNLFSCRPMRFSNPACCRAGRAGRRSSSLPSLRRIVMFALSPGFWTILAVVVILSIAMFTPLKFIHPVRTERWRAVSLPMAIAWTFFAGWAAWQDFHPDSWAHWGLVVTSLYLLCAGILQQIIPERGKGRRARVGVRISFWKREKASM